MAKISSNTTIPTKWDESLDAAEIISKVEAAKDQTTRRFLFAGETHTSPYDKQRNLKIADKFYEDPKVIVLVERGMFADRAEQYILAGSSVIQEKNQNLKPSDPQRDQLVVEQLMPELQKDVPNAKPRPVLIIFGQDHETRILQNLAQKLPEEDQIDWVSFPTITEQINDLPADSRTDLTGNYKLLGIVASGDLDLGPALLSKGLVHNEFVMDVQITHNPPRTPSLLAVYLLEGPAYDALFLVVDNKLSAKVTVAGDYVWQLRPVQRNQIETLKDEYKGLLPQEL